MRIVITSNYKLGNETGTAHVAEDLANFFSKNNFVTYVCLGKKYSVIKKTNKLTILKIPSIEINKIAIPLITPDVVYKVFAYLNNFKPKVIHSQNSLFISNLVQTWANFNSVPFIVTFHHIPTEALDHLFPKLSKGILTNLVQDLYKDFSLTNFLNNTDCVIALNKQVFDSVRTVNKLVKVEIINNGLNLKNLLKIKPKKIDPNNTIFTFVGSYNERKNQEFLIKTFKFLPTYYKLELFGNKNSGMQYVKRLKIIIDQLKLINISINGYSNDLVSIYASTNFFISASIKEAQSLAVIQSLASGKPVIALSNETIHELINSNNGLVLSQSITPHEFAREIEKYISGIDYKKTSLTTRQSIDKFKLENVTLKIKNTYQSTTCQNSDNGRRKIGQYYQEIFKSIVFKQ